MTDKHYEYRFLNQLHIEKHIDLIHAYISDVYEQNIFPRLNRSWLGPGTKEKRINRISAE